MHAGRLWNPLVLLAKGREERNLNGREPPQVGLTPRLRAARGVRWPAKLRWVSAGAVAVVCLLARVSDPRLLPPAALAAAVLLALLSTASLRRFCTSSTPGPVGKAGLVPLGLDLLVLALLTLFSGGLHSPLAPFFLLVLLVTPFVAGSPLVYVSALLAGLLLALIGVLGDAALLRSPAGMASGGLDGSTARLPATAVGWLWGLLLVAWAARRVSLHLLVWEQELGEVRLRLEGQAEELRMVNLKLEKVVRTKTSPMLRIAHQLRAPLSSIQGLLEVILKGYADGTDAGAQEMLELARDSAAGMLELVNDLLYLGHVREVGFAVTGELVDLNEIAREVVRTNEGVAQLKGVQIAAQTTEEGAARIQGNGDFTRQMVGNLVENGIKYTPPGGKVVVSVNSGDARVVIAVSDTGIGIRKEDLPRVFEEFFRAENARRAQRVGTGLGLAIARQIAELQGGEITVASELGRGSTFAVRFPVFAGEGLKAEGLPAAACAGGGRGG